MKKFSFAILTLFVAFEAISPAQAAEPAPIDLRCEFISNPQGIDTRFPWFSWQLSPTGERGQRQSAWQIRAGSSEATLAGDQPDLWDSGRRESDSQLQVRYEGRPLQSHERLFWQVRAWNQHGAVSSWSKPATITMGMIHFADWEPAKWITDEEFQRWQRKKLGFSSNETADPDTLKWIQLDLGRPQAIDQVRLYPVRHTVVEKLGFPQRFKLEVADDETFANSRVVLDHSTKDYGDKETLLIDAAVGGVTARFIRMTVPRLRVEEGMARLAFSQIEVISRGKNVAAGATVTASDSIEDELWGASSVVDGRGVPGSNPHANRTLLLRREFSVRPGLRRALLKVSGLGCYTLHLNGRMPFADLFTPGWTNFAKTVLYDTHDITDQLKEGANVAGLELAGGMYNVQPGRYTKFVTPFRPLAAIAHLRLEYQDGTFETVVTDSSWRVRHGPIIFSNMFGGEDYDARLAVGGWNREQFDDSGWSSAAETNGPGGSLRGATHASPPLRTFETLRPVSFRELRAGTAVYDLGQNASITLRLRVRGPAGSRVKITPAEVLHPDGSVYLESVSHGAPISWNYTLAGDPDVEEWRPRYFYHGSRYLQVERLPGAAEGALPEIDLIEGLVTHSDSPPVGEFSCSNELFNRIRTLIRWAQRSNLAHVISDCPHRERLGWLEQYHLNGPALRYEWDLARLYRKTFADMTDSQLASGLVPSIAPEYVKFSDGFRDSPEWGSALALAVWQQFVWTGDETPLRQNYAAIRRYADYLTSRSTDGIVSHGLGDWLDLGPQKSIGYAQLTPIPVTATAFYYLTVETVARISEYLGETENAQRYTELAEQIKQAFNREFFDVGKSSYATGSQTSNALPLVLGFVPAGHREAVLANLVQDVRAHGNAPTGGDVGHRYFLRALADSGRSDVIYDVHSQSEKPGYGYQLAQGATSLTEAWDALPYLSQNHFMLGHIMEWFYHDLAGLAPDPSAPGFKKVVIAPQPVDGVTWAKAAYASPRGRFSVSWKNEPDDFHLEVELPPNTSATISIPAASIERVREGGQPASGAPGIRFLRQEGGRAVFAVESGRYHFTSTLPAPKRDPLQSNR